MEQFQACLLNKYLDKIGMSVTQALSRKIFRTWREVQPVFHNSSSPCDATIITCCSNINDQNMISLIHHIVTLKFSTFDDIMKSQWLIFRLSDVWNLRCEFMVRFLSRITKLRYKNVARRLYFIEDTPRQKSIRALEIVLAIFLCFECQFLSFYACYKEYKA